MTTQHHLPIADLTAEEKMMLRGMRKRKMELIDEIEQIKDEMQRVEGELETLYYVDETSTNRMTLLITGRKKFNINPEQGLEYLIERGLVERTPQSVAEFLFKGDGLSKAAVGDYLGSNDPFNLQVLDEFIIHHDFTNLFLVDALRVFLWSFRLPGESQKIDRIIEKFSSHYCAQNVGFFESSDVCFVLAYSCIMLNTLLHNPNVKDKPSVSRYADMNKELIEKNSVRMDTISSIYDSIQRQAFKLPDDDTVRQAVVFLNPEREGWLYKQSSTNFLSGPLSWKRRWFVLSDGCLYYFESTPDRTPRGIIPLRDVGVKRIEAGPRPHMFEIFSLSEHKIKACKHEQAGKVVEGRHSSYRMAANSQDDLREWIEAISAGIQQQTRPHSTH